MSTTSWQAVVIALRFVKKKKYNPVMMFWTQDVFGNLANMKELDEKSE